MASGKVVRYFLETANTDEPRSGNRVVTEQERREEGARVTNKQGKCKEYRNIYPKHRKSLKTKENGL